MAEKAVVYITDNRLDEPLASQCRLRLLDAAGGIPVVCVSQQPVSFGSISISVGDLPRSLSSMTAQIMAGLERVDARWVYIAEHDCLYSKEHFEFIPSDPSCFWYNRNVWLVQHRNPNHPEYDGMYSIKKHMFHQSQMLGTTEMMRLAQGLRLSILKDSLWVEKHPGGRIGEPGAADFDKAMKLASGIQPESPLMSKIISYCSRFKARSFRTATPNIDIRHGGNFSGPLRGKNRTWHLEPWGRWDSVFS